MMQSTIHVFGHQCDVISISHTIYRHLISNFSPFCSPVKEKGKQWRIKGLTMEQWINLNQNNRSVLAHQYSVLWEKTSPILLLVVVLMAQRLTGRLADNILVGFKIFKVLYQLNYSGFYLQCYYSIRTAFQSAFVN